MDIAYCPAGISYFKIPIFVQLVTPMFLDWSTHHTQRMSTKFICDGAQFVSIKRPCLQETATLVSHILAAALSNPQRDKINLLVGSGCVHAFWSSAGAGKSHMFAVCPMEWANTSDASDTQKTSERQLAVWDKPLKELTQVKTQLKRLSTGCRRSKCRLGQALEGFTRPR